MKLYLYLIIVIIILAGSLSASIYLLKVRTDERDRWENNYNTQVDTSNYYKDKAGHNAITINELQLTAKEVKNSTDSVIIELERENRNMGNKLRNTEQLLKIATLSTNTITLTLRDTIIEHDTIIQRVGDTTAKTATYHDKWISIDALLFMNSLKLNYSFKDDLIISIGWHRERKNFFLWRWLGFGRKIYDCDIKSTNENTRITYTKNVRFTGKRGRN